MNTTTLTRPVSTAKTAQPTKQLSRDYILESIALAVEGSGKTVFGLENLEHYQRNEFAALKSTD